MFFDIFFSLLKAFCLFEGEGGGSGGDGDGKGGSAGDGAGDGDGDTGASGDKGKKEGDGDGDGDKGAKLPDDFDQAKWDKLKEVDPERWEKLKDIDVEKHSEAMELLESVSKDEALYEKVLKAIQDHKEKGTDPETKTRLDALEKEISERKTEEFKGKFEAERDKIAAEIVKETSLKELSEFEKDYLNTYVLGQFKGKELKIDQMKTVVKEAVERIEKNHKDRLAKSVKKGGPDPIKGGGQEGETKHERDLTDKDTRVKDSISYLQEKMST